MKIFTSAQIRELDKYTIENCSISSIDLMERAATEMTNAIVKEWNSSKPVVVFAGSGNNGGDALAVARLLVGRGYRVSVYLFNVGDKISEDCAVNRERISQSESIEHFVEIKQQFDLPNISKDTLIIDGLFGTGLNKPLTGGFAQLVKYINKSEGTIVSLDIPSGLMSEDNTYNASDNIIRAHTTLTLQNRKLSFLFRENQKYIGDLKVLDIGLSKKWMDAATSLYHVTERRNITARMTKRNSFAHKGDMGHALLVAGCYGMAGAAILAAKACLKSGAGKVTVHTPTKNNDILQISVPEAIMSHDKSDRYFTEPIDTASYNAVGIGCGLGTEESTSVALIAQIRRTNAPIVLDADAINILASHRAWIQQLPENVIFTPHVKEFEKLMGTTYSDSYERLHAALKFAERSNAYIILKGHYSALCTPHGQIVFNPTGNAGMATAGSGDVLTGIITALLAKGYNQHDACVSGMYIHGLAGDIAAEHLGMESMTAGDIINCLPEAFKSLNEDK